MWKWTALVLHDTKELVLIMFGTVVTFFVFWSPYLLEMYIELFIGKMIECLEFV